MAKIRAASCRRAKDFEDLTAPQLPHRAHRHHRLRQMAPEPVADYSRWIHYGSSTSHCQDADTPLGVWPVAAANHLGLHIHNLGLGGCAHLEQFAARPIRDLPADLISLIIGINIVNGASVIARTLAPAVQGFTDTVREGNPTAPIVIISPIWRPGHEQSPWPSMTSAAGIVVGQSPSEHSWIGELTLEGIREPLRGVAHARYAIDRNIHDMDGLNLFDQEEARSMPDGIHPSAQGYAVIARNFDELFPRERLSQR